MVDLKLNKFCKLQNIISISHISYIFVCYKNLKIMDVSMSFVNPVESFYSFLVPLIWTAYKAGTAIVSFCCRQTSVPYQISSTCTREFCSWNVVDWHVTSPLCVYFMHKRIQNKICWQATMRVRLWTRCMGLRVKWKQSTLPRCQNCSLKCTTGCHWPIVLTAESWSVCWNVQTFLCMCLFACDSDRPCVLSGDAWGVVLQGWCHARWNQ
jgi:hypothetical protein